MISCILLSQFIKLEVIALRNPFESEAKFLQFELMLRNQWNWYILLDICSKSSTDNQQENVNCRLSDLSDVLPSITYYLIV